MKLADLRAIEKATAREAPDASPEEKKELVAKGTEILASKRSAGEPITPDLAVKEASLSWSRSGFAAEIHFTTWLIEHGWRLIEVSHAWPGQPDLVAERKGWRIVVEVKVVNRRLGVDAVYQVLALTRPPLARPDRATAVDVQIEPGRVLVLGEAGLTEQAADIAAKQNISVYTLDADNEITHLIGPELD